MTFSGDTMKIVMGDVTDYFRPQPPRSDCDVFDLAVDCQKFRWAASERGTLLFWTGVHLVYMALGWWRYSHSWPGCSAEAVKAA